MPETVILSADAVAVLRFEIKGYRSKIKGSRLPAYRELTAAGIMEAVPARTPNSSSLMTAWPDARQYSTPPWRIYIALEPRLPSRIEPSEAARIVLAQHVAVKRK